MNIIETIEQPAAEGHRSRRSAPGDALRIHVRIVEGDKERIQLFEGVCIRRSGGSIRETFTVRKTSYGVGVERTFPLHSPRVDKIEVVSYGKVRRAKLYYLRELSGKAARIEEDTSTRTTKTKSVAPSSRAARHAARGRQPRAGWSSSASDSSRFMRRSPSKIAPSTTTSARVSMRPNTRAPAWISTRSAPSICPRTSPATTRRLRPDRAVHDAARGDLEEVASPAPRRAAALRCASAP